MLHRSGSVKNSHLWDGWVTYDHGAQTFHRFILSAPSSASLTSSSGELAERDRLAEIRQFVSKDGRVWRDLGSTRIPGWSGNAVIHRNRLNLFYTKKGRDEQRIQLAVDKRDGRGFRSKAKVVLDPGHPATKKRAEQLGYHLRDGDGYVMAWRDPYVFKQGSQWHMLFAAKALVNGKVVPAVGHATSQALHDWTLKAPQTPANHEGPLAGQIELPILLTRKNVHYLFVSHSDNVNGSWVRTTKAFMRNDDSKPWRPVDGKSGTIIPASKGIYGFNALPDPHRPGEFLVHAFYNEGPRKMQPTPMQRLKWKGDLPSVEFSGTFQ